jgi:hypothetical protein
VNEEVPIELYRKENGEFIKFVRYEEINKKEEEIERLNNIINRMEEDLKEMYMTFGEFNEEYTEKKIRELKEGK